MIFEQEYVVFEILDVFFLNQSFMKKANLNRNFDAISFRYKSDTIIETSTQQIELYDDSICYFPSNTPYTRISKNDELIVIHFKSFNYHSNNIEYFLPTEPQKYRKLFKQNRKFQNCVDILIISIFRQSLKK